MQSSSTTDPIWEERWHPFREEWIIVAAHRNNRPWVGVTAAVEKNAPRFDPTCFLCPGNTRISGKINPKYEGVFVFDNDHPAIGEDAPTKLEHPHTLFRKQDARGVSRVICYSPRHDLTLAQMSEQQIMSVVVEWQRQTRDLGARDFVKHVLITESRGEIMGMSNAHPHGQIYATNFVWKTVEDELRAMRRHFDATRKTLLSEIIEAEQTEARRILFEDEHSIVFVPFFARFAYETIVAPKRAVPVLNELRESEVESLARAVRELTVRYDNLWRMSFPYVMTVHQAPLDGGDYTAFHAHLQFHPPLRQPRLQKFLAAPEIGGGNFLSDTSPESKAAELRAVSNVHYMSLEE